MSSRYALYVCILLLFALVPTGIHTYYGARHIDGKSVSLIKIDQGSFASGKDKRGPKWGEIIFASNDWIDRDYTTSSGSKVKLFAARSYDLKKIYHHPELAILYGNNVREAGIVNYKEYPGIPFHVLKEESGRGIGAYVLLYDGEYISNPISFQILTSIKMLFGPRKPMTIILAYEFGTRQEDIRKTQMANILLNAINGFNTQSSDL